MSFYQRHLPHYQPIGYAYFVTTRLSGTIPKHLYDKYKDEYVAKLKNISELKSLKEKTKLYHKLNKEHFLEMEKILDSCSYGNVWLGNKKVAEIIKKTFHFYDDKRYNLICYTIMPNHIHLIFFPLIESYNNFLQVHIKKKKTEDTFYFVTKIIQDIKKYSAKESNKILKRSGKFWQSESYDHVIRNKTELLSTVEYVLNNPVKAGLCENREDWKWNFYNPKFLA